MQSEWLLKQKFFVSVNLIFYQEPIMKEKKHPEGFQHQPVWKAPENMK